MVAADGDIDREPHAARGIVGLDGAVVQFHQHLGQAQAHAGADFGVQHMGLEEPLEDLVLVARFQARPGVGDVHADELPDALGQDAGVGFRRAHADGDGAAVGGVLEGVRQEVEDDLVEVALVDPQVLHRPDRFQRQGDVPGDGHVVEGLHDVPDEIDHVRFQEVQLHLSLVHLPHVHELVHQPEDTKRIAVHQVVLALLVGIFLGLAHLLERGHQEGERGADLMGDVGEHLEFEVLDLGRFPFLLMAGPPADDLPQQQDAGGQQQEIAQEGPGRQIPRGLDPDADGTGRKGILVAVEEGLDCQCVTPGRQIRVGGDPGGGGDGMPVVVEMVQPVGIADLAGVRVLEDGERQREGILLVGEVDAGGLGDVLVQNVDLAGRVVVHFLVLDGEPGEGDRRNGVRLLAHDLRIEERHAADAAEQQLSVGVPEGGAEMELVTLEAVIDIVIGEGPAGGIQMGEAIGR